MSRRIVIELNVPLNGKCHHTYDNTVVWDVSGTLSRGPCPLTNFKETKGREGRVKAWTTRKMDPQMV